MRKLSEFRTKLTVIFLTAVFSLFAGCASGDEMVNVHTDKVDYSITPQMLCDYYNLPESTFDGIDFDLFLFYLDADWDFFHSVSLEYVRSALEEYRAIPDEDKNYEGIERIKEIIYADPLQYAYLTTSVCGKSLADENMDELSTIMYCNEYGSNTDLWILDFSHQVTFYSNDIRKALFLDSATGIADESMKNDIIEKISKLENSDWWKKSENEWWNNYSPAENGDDVMPGYPDGIYVWTIYFEFDNGDVIKLIGNGKEDSYETIPNDLADFSHYVRLLAENNI